MKRRVFLLGLDGASWNVIDRMFTAGCMPNLQRLCAEGVRATLESTVPSITPVAWSSLMTGVNPGKHGIYGFMQRTQGASMQTVMCNRMQIKVPTLFDYYQEPERIVSLNLPMSYPATPISGSMITGMMTPLNSLADHEHPPGLLAQLRRQGIDYVIDPRMDEPEDIDPADMYEGWRKAGEAFVNKLVTITDNRLKAAHLLMAEESWNLFICVIVGTDRLQHLYWDQLLPADGSPPDPSLARYYQLVDEHIGRLVDKLEPEDTLLIVSDHGFVKLQGNFMTNEWLRRQGWLTQRDVRKSLRYSLKLFLNKLGITRARLSRYLSKKSISKLQLTASHVDWAASTACLGSPFGIRINLQGRQPWGKVSRDRYDEVCDAIIASLREVQDTDGQRVIQNVYKSSEIYHGETASDAPDIVFTFRDDKSYVAYAGEIGGDVFQKARDKTGDHRRDGIFVGWGGGIRRIPSEARFQILDVLPTIMHLNGKAVPAICDGRVLTEILADQRDVAIDSDWQRFRGKTKTVRYDEAQQRDITARLKALGYISDD